MMKFTILINRNFIFAWCKCARRYFFPPMVQQPLVGQDLPIIEASQLIRLLRMSDQPNPETCTWQHTAPTRDRHPCPWVGFKPTVLASEQLRTQALDCTATGTVPQDYRILPSVKLIEEGFLSIYCHPFCLLLYIQKIINFPNHNGNSSLVWEG
jgi:hypothetical protein